MNKLPVGLQLYTVRDHMEKDVEATLTAVKAMGYDYVETAGIFDKTPEQFKAILDKLDLKAISAHVSLEQMLEDLNGIINAYKTIGCEYIVVPYMADGKRPNQPEYEATLQAIDTIGAACKEAGLTLLYHNHDFEFVKMENGDWGLDDMYRRISADHLQTELDLCWVNVGGENPANYVRKYAGRCPVVHFKDFEGEKSANMYKLIGIETEEQAETTVPTFKLRPVGSGKQDFPEIMKACLESGAKYVITEQDETYELDSLDAAKQSREYLKNLGW